MADTKVPVRTETSSAQRAQQWHPFEHFRREMDRLFDDLAGGFLGRTTVRSLGPSSRRKYFRWNARC